MARVAIIVTGVLVALLVAAQLALPPLAEKRIEDRLTENGGSADAEVDPGIPAARLLAGHGDRIDVSGSGLDLDIDPDNSQVLDRLDGFASVAIDLTDFQAGPFEVDSFELSRDGSSPYSLSGSLVTTAAALASYGADRLGIPGASLLPLITGASDDSIADKPIPVELDMELTSDDGRITVTSGGGTVAGFPTGPLAELITQAIVVQL